MPVKGQWMRLQVQDHNQPVNKQYFIGCLYSKGWLEIGDRQPALPNHHCRWRPAILHFDVPMSGSSVMSYTALRTQWSPRTFMTYGSPSPR